MSSIFDEMEILMNKSSGFLSPFELRVLRLYAQKSIKKMALDDGIKASQIYSVFQRLRKRRLMFREATKLFRDLCKRKRFQRRLTPWEMYEEKVE